MGCTHGREVTAADPSLQKDARGYETERTATNDLLLFKGYKRSETSEGVSAMGVSIHVGDFPDSDDDGAVLLAVMDAKPRDEPRAAEPKPWRQKTAGINSAETDRMAKEIHPSTTTTRDNSHQGILLPSDRADVDSLVESIQRRRQTDRCSEGIGQGSVVSNSMHRDMDQYDMLLERMLADEDQLLRILIARQRKIAPSTDLFLEQLRFRLRWRPQDIGPNDIPNALPCKYCSS
jgi:hypothetical protein